MCIVHEQNFCMYTKSRNENRAFYRVMPAVQARGVFESIVVYVKHLRSISKCGFVRNNSF